MANLNKLIKKNPLSLINRVYIPIQEKVKDTTCCIITSHNYGIYLRECIESCLNQTKPFDEIVVIDDASSDNTKEIISNYSNIKYHRVEFNHAAYARKEGLTISNYSTYVIFVDADNILTENYHEKLLVGMTKNYIAGCYGRLIKFKSPMNIVGEHESIRGFDKNLIRRIPIIDSCFLCRRQVLEQIEDCFDSPKDGLQDWTLTNKIVNLGWDFFYCPDAILLYRIHEKQLSEINKENFDRYVESISKWANITIVTPFSGREWSLDRYFNFLNNLDWPYNRIHLLVLDNSRRLDFNKKLQEKLYNSKFSFSYHKINFSFNKNLFANEWADDKKSRIKDTFLISSQMAKLYSIAKEYIPNSTSYIWCLEDDIEPPIDILKRIFMHFTKNWNAGLIVAPIQSRMSDGYLFFENNKRIKTNPKFLIGGESMTFACSIFRKETWDKLTFRPSIEWSKYGTNSYDRAASKDINILKYKTLLAYDCPTKHHMENGEFLI